MLRDDVMRIDELLAGRALGDLDRDEASELDTLLQENPSLDTDEFDRTAAALLSVSATSTSMPAALQEKIVSDAPNYLPTYSEANVNKIPVEISDSTRSMATRELIAWTIAASCLFVLLSPMFTGIGDESSLAENRLALLENADDVINVNWGPGLHPFDVEVKGDVVWSTERQQGFMRFVDMPVNDPTKEQYQLWIIDPERDDEPIDGGVFDVSDDGEVIVPIDAKLVVIDPQKFAVTIEKPGGVVESTQDRLPLLANASQ